MGSKIYTNSKKSEFTFFSAWMIFSEFQWNLVDYIQWIYPGKTTKSGFSGFSGFANIK